MALTEISVAQRVDPQKMIISPQGHFPVDFKYTRRRPHRNHISQLAGYAVLVEEHFHTEVETAFIYLAPVGEL